ncbi:hypothetical protein RRF57_009987 [Xylaria bambusicola]|uniref:Uncharacterized protein n=1 Tax=Xylaria bambusicola TaxID=326684 RepID=A0AAN7URJ8_9PEZI
MLHGRDSGLHSRQNPRFSVDMCRDDALLTRRLLHDDIQLLGTELRIQRVIVERQHASAREDLNAFRTAPDL